MKKEWNEATVVEVEISSTAFGPVAPENPDSDKTAVYGDDGKLIGWKQKFGEGDPLGKTSGN